MRRVDKVLNFRYNKKVKIESCTNCTANFFARFRYFCYVSYPHCGNWNSWKRTSNTFILFMYLTRTAGIETISWWALHCARFFQNVSYPHCGNWNFRRFLNRIIIHMYLTRTAGIETISLPPLSLMSGNVSYPHCGNWNNHPSTLGRN